MIFMSKRGALKAKYSCAVHSDFYCFAPADICRRGLLHMATRIACTNICRPMRSNEVWMHHIVTSFQYKWSLMMRSDFHCCALANVCWPCFFFLVDYLRVNRTNIRNAQSCCERLYWAPEEAWRDDEIINNITDEIHFGRDNWWHNWRDNIWTR